MIWLRWIMAALQPGNGSLFYKTEKDNKLLGNEEKNDAQVLLISRAACLATDWPDRSCSEAAGGRRGMGIKRLFSHGLLFEAPEGWN